MNYLFISKLMVIAFVLIAINIIFQKTLFAQSSTPNIQNLQIFKVNGEVEKIDDRNLYLKTAENTYQVTIPQDALIKKNSSPALMTEIKPGDKLIITQTESGLILSVDATTPETIDATKWLVPVVVSGLLLATILWWVTKKNSKAYFETI